MSRGGAEQRIGRECSELARAATNVHAYIRSGRADQVKPKVTAYGVPC